MRLAKIFLIILIFLSYIKVWGQTTYTVGLGTGTQSQPLGILYGYMRSAMIFKPSELGNSSGNITSIGFSVSIRPNNNIPCKVYMKHVSGTFTNTTATTIANEISGATLVFNGTINRASMTNDTYYTLNLTTSFSYNGTSHLEIIVFTDYGGTGGGSSSYKYTTNYTSVSPGIWYHQTWMADNSAPTGTGSISSSRPNMTITKGGVLPITLSNFSAICIQDYIKLNWSTQSEINNDYFEVERSENGLDFNSITRIDGNGTINVQQNYQYIDEQSLFGTSYYRLKQVDFDGKVEYFNPIFLDCKKTNNFSIYPNPNNGSFVVSGLSEDEEMQLTDALGRTLLSKKGEINYEINNLQEGIYIITIKNKFGPIQIQKIVVHR